MDGFFNQNNLFYRLMGLLFDLVVLNVITLIISIPLFTAGAALTALNTCLWKIVRNEDGKLLPMYFRALKENFTQVTPVWLGVLVIMGIGAADVYFLLHLNEFVPSIGQGGRVAFFAVFALMIIAVTAVVEWYTVLVSRYSNTTIQHLKNAALASLGYFPQTFFMTLLLVGTAVIYVIFYGYAIPVALLVGISLPQYCCALIYTPLFAKLDGEESRNK